MSIIFTFHIRKYTFANINDFQGVENVFAFSHQDVGDLHTYQPRL